MSDRQAKIVRALGVFLGCDQVTELRALNVQGRTRSAVFGPAEHEALAARALEWEAEGATGVFCENGLEELADEPTCRDADDFFHALKTHTPIGEGNHLI